MATITTSTQPSTAIAGNGKNANYRFALNALFTLFFLWGFITCLNDIIIPHLKALLTLNYAEAMLVQFAFFIAYAVISIPAGFMLKKTGYKNGIVIGLAIMGAACFIFCPAASELSYPIFLIGFFVLAAGITILQVAANPYVALLGKPQTSSSRLNLAQAFNSLGTTIAPYIGAIIVLGVAIKTSAELGALSTQQLSAYYMSQKLAVQVPYIVIGIILFIIAIFFLVIKLPRLEGIETPSKKVKSDTDVKEPSAWARKHLLLGSIAIFLYVGAEVSIGSFLVLYMNQSYIADFSFATGAKMVALYWGGAMIGRFIGSAVQKKIAPSKVLAFNAVIAIILVVITMVTFGYIAMYAIILVGLFNSIMFPTIFSLAIEDLGTKTNQGSSLLCTAIVGGAIIPVLQGVLADSITIHYCFIIPALCYAFILYYGLKGHKYKSIHKLAE